MKNCAKFNKSIKSKLTPYEFYGCAILELKETSAFQKAPEVTAKFAQWAVYVWEQDLLPVDICIETRYSDELFYRELIYTQNLHILKQKASKNFFMMKYYNPRVLKWKMANHSKIWQKSSINPITLRIWKTEAPQELF